EYRKSAGFNQGQGVGEFVVPSVDNPPPNQGVAGVGTYTRMVIANGQPAGAYALSPTSPSDSKEGHFALRTPSGWRYQQVSTLQGAPGQPPSLVSSPTAGFAIAFYAVGDLYVATSSDGTSFTTGAVEALGETGQYPALAYAGSTLGVVYAYCHSPI